MNLFVSLKYLVALDDHRHFGRAALAFARQHDLAVYAHPARVRLDAPQRQPTPDEGPHAH